MTATAFTADASRALPGPAWLSDRRLAAFERLGSAGWPSTAEEIWRYSRIDEFDLDRYRPIPPEEIGEPGDERAPGGGPWAAEAGERAGMVVVRDGRVVHHELDPSLAAKGVHLCDFATCGASGFAREHLGSAEAAGEDAFTLLHDAFLAGGAVVAVPEGVVVEKPIVVLHWSEGDGCASFPHTLVVAGEGSEVTVLDRFGSAPDAQHLVDAVVELQVGDGANVRYLSVQEHGDRAWHVGLQRAVLGRDATLRSSAVALGYLVLPFSGFSIWTRLGVLTAVIISVSALATLMLIPSLALVARPRFLECVADAAAMERTSKRLAVGGAQ